MPQPAVARAQPTIRVAEPVRASYAWKMERSQAERLRDRMAAEHPDRDTHSFILSEQNGEWRVAKVAVPPNGASPTTTTNAERDPLHDHSPQKLPGGVSPWAAGG